MFPVHLMVKDLFLLDRSERAKTNVQSNIRNVHTHCF